VAQKLKLGINCDSRVRNVICKIFDPTENDYIILMNTESKYKLLIYEERENVIFCYLEFKNSTRLKKLSSKLSKSTQWVKRKSNSTHLTKEAKRGRDPTTYFEEGILSDQGSRNDLR
jgi:hypothetical protein